MGVVDITRVSAAVIGRWGSRASSYTCRVAKAPAGRPSEAFKPSFKRQSHKGHGAKYPSFPSTYQKKKSSIQIDE